MPWPSGRCWRTTTASATSGSTRTASVRPTAAKAEKNTPFSLLLHALKGRGSEKNEQPEPGSRGAAGRCESFVLPFFGKMGLVFGRIGTVLQEDTRFSAFVSDLQDYLVD